MYGTKVMALQNFGHLCLGALYLDESCFTHLDPVYIQYTIFSSFCKRPPLPLNSHFLAPTLYLVQMDETGCPTKKSRMEEAYYDEEDPSLFRTMDAEAIHQALAMNGALVQQGATQSQSCNDFKQHLLNTLC